MSPLIGIVQYDAGNIRSVVNALKRLNVAHVVSSDPKELDRANGIILPGVGEARSAMDALEGAGLVPWLRDVNVPFLGLCLGMQVLFDRSEERETECLGIIPGTISRFAGGNGLKVPHMGWNRVFVRRPSPLFKEIPDGSFFYFVHSYFAPVSDATVASVEYGVSFAAAVESGRRYGVQFHPEKSGEQGLLLLKNFVSLC